MPPRPDDTRVPSLPQTSPAADPSAPGSETRDAGPVVTDIPVPDRDESLGANSAAPEIERTKVEENSEQQRQ